MIHHQMFNEKIYLKITKFNAYINNTFIEIITKFNAFLT